MLYLAQSGESNWLIYVIAPGFSADLRDPREVAPGLVLELQLRDRILVGLAVLEHEPQIVLVAVLDPLQPA